MPVTWKDAKKLLAQYAGRGGRCPDDAETDLFVKQVLQFMLYSAPNGSLRKFCFTAPKGCFTIPYELETPLKVKIGGEVGTVWNRWFDMYNQFDLGQCMIADEALMEEANTFPTVYDVPYDGANIGVIGTAEEDTDAHIIVQGIDLTGREVITNHQGNQIQGEYLRIRRGELRYSTVKFRKITGVIKTKTKGYVQLMWVTPELQNKGFLSDYSPNEQIPQYRRFRLTTRKCDNVLQVSVLGRIRLKESYVDDDILPFDNLYAISLAGQTVHAQGNDNVQVAQAKDQTLQDIITRENEYKRVQPGSPLEVFVPLSAGNIRGIV
jgi:hypothetical protein